MTKTHHSLIFVYIIDLKLKNNKLYFRDRKKSATVAINYSYNIAVYSCFIWDLATQWEMASYWQFSWLPGSLNYRQLFYDSENLRWIEFCTPFFAVWYIKANIIALVYPFYLIKINFGSFCLVYWNICSLLKWQKLCNESIWYTIQTSLTI